MHDSMARLVGAREAANRLLNNDSGVPRGWPTAATPYHHALAELMAAVDEVVEITRYPVNPDFPEEGTDLHAEFRGAAASR